MTMKLPPGVTLDGVKPNEPIANSQWSFPELEPKIPTITQQVAMDEDDEDWSE